MKDYLLEQDKYDIEALIYKLENEDIDVIYKLFANAKYSNGSSVYSALINDIIKCCPSSEQWRNPRNREIFKQDVKYYCDYYLTVVNGAE